MSEHWLDVMYGQVKKGGEKSNENSQPNYDVKEIAAEVVKLITNPTQEVANPTQEEVANPTQEEVANPTQDVANPTQDVVNN